jgi:hypothetical protein
MLGSGAGLGGGVGLSTGVGDVVSAGEGAGVDVGAGVGAGGALEDGEGAGMDGEVAVASAVTVSRIVGRTRVLAPPATAVAGSSGGPDSEVGRDASQLASTRPSPRTSSRCNHGRDPR